MTTIDNGSLISNSTQALKDKEVGGISAKTSQTILIYLCVQAALGILALEYAWKRSKRFRQIDEIRDG
jgi:hypothetical protein